MNKALCAGERVYIKGIEYKDALEFKNRDNFEDPKFFGYNYGFFDEFDSNLRYMSVKTPCKKYFAVRTENPDRFIGFIGLKSIKYLKKSAKLGIVFNPKFTGKGYGYEAMKIFLNYYFNVLNFKILYLDVNSFNENAKKLYLKLGFKKTGLKREIFENQKCLPDGINLFEKNGTIYSDIIQMSLTKEGF